MLKLKCKIFMFYAYNLGEWGEVVGGGRRLFFTLLSVRIFIYCYTDFPLHFLCLL